MTLCYGHLSYFTFQFRLTSSHRGWPSCQTQSQIDYNFDSHPLTEDDSPQSSHQWRPKGNFDSHPLTEDDDSLTSNIYLKHLYFDSHPLTEDDVKPSIAIISSLVFRLTSSHRGWRSILQLSRRPRHISTHILSQRMTYSCSASLRSSIISTHILSQRMTTTQYFFAPRQAFRLTSSHRGWPQYYVSTMHSDT